MNSAEVHNKIFIDANQLLNDAFLLGETILASGFNPSMLIALWRGGTPVGIAIQELLAYRGIPHEHYSLKTRHYAGLGERHNDILIEGLEPILAKIAADTRLLIVDDVFDTGLTLDKLVREIKHRSAIDPAHIRVAAPWFKPGNNRTDWQPDYFLHQTDHWIVFPHELRGLSREELVAGKPELPALKNL